MAELGAVNLVGESIAALLRARRSLLAAEGRLAPVPPSQDIAHVAIAKLIGTSPPTSGLSITCYRIERSDQTLGRGAMQDPSRGGGISLELSYMIAAWSATPADEQALLSWAMLELDRYPVLDQGQLIGGNAWARGESVQLVPEDLPLDQVLRIWDGFKLKYRLSFFIKARVVRIGYGPSTDALPVVASRLEFTDADPMTEPTL